MAIYYDYDSPTSVVQDADAISNSIKNIILTRKGSVPGKPTFGSNLYKVVFDHIDHIIVSLIKSYIIEAILEFEPRVRVKQVQVKEIPEYNRVIVNVTYEYNINGYTDTSSVSIQLKD